MLISKKTLNEFREHLALHTLHEIEMEFEAAEIACDTGFNPACSGQRRALVEQYYHSLDLGRWSDVRRLLQVFENVLTSLESQQEPSRWSDAASPKRISTNLQGWLRKDGYVFKNGRLETAGAVTSAHQLSEAAQHLNAQYIRTQIDRMNGAIDGDPRLAIGTAKELIETVCKTILTERGTTFDPSADIMELWKLARKELALAPDDVPDAAKAADTVRKVLNSLTSVVQSLAELRNPYGTGHGPDGKAKGLRARHARLAVGAAATLATFLFDTYSERERRDG